MTGTRAPSRSKAASLTLLLVAEVAAMAVWFAATASLAAIRQHWTLSPFHEALLTSSHYENGQLIEVRLYPVDCGGPDRPGSQLGNPKRPSPAVARRILEDVAEYSKPFGTKIAIENGVGIIRLAANPAGRN